MKIDQADVPFSETFCQGAEEAGIDSMNSPGPGLHKDHIKSQFEP